MIIRHEMNGDEHNGWTCWTCNYFTRNVAEAAKHDGETEPAPPAPAAQETAETMCSACAWENPDQCTNRRPCSESASLRAEVARLQEELQRAYKANDGNYALRTQAEEQAARLQHEFQNFHRSLCERFGYTHDPVDWRRDQVSLEEYMAEQVARLEKERDGLVDLNNKLAKINVQVQANCEAAEARIRELEGGK